MNIYDFVPFHHAFSNFDAGLDIGRIRLADYSRLALKACLVSDEYSLECRPRQSPFGSICIPNPDSFGNFDHPTQVDFIEPALESTDTDWTMMISAVLLNSKGPRRRLQVKLNGRDHHY